MANATKAQLESALAAAQARISELEAQAEQPKAAAPHLSQVLWLQRKPLAEAGPDGRGNISYTRTGVLVVRFGAQYASLNRQTGQRVFGPWRFFTAYGETASAIIAFMAGEDRLAAIEAYEEPWSSSTDPNARQSDWVVRGFTPVGRGAGNPPVPPATRPEAAPAAPVPAPQPELAQLAF